MRDLSLGVLALVTLSACGGSGSDAPTVITVPAAFTATGDSDVDVELSASGDIINVTKSGGPIAVPTDTAPDIGTFRTAFEGTGDYTIAFASMSDTSVAGGAVFEDGPDQTNGVFYERIGVTNLPTTGTATFNGDYVGVLIVPATMGTVFGAGFRGDAEINVDFGNTVVDGTVSNREFISLATADVTPDTSVADLELSETELTTQGRFAGLTIGGELTTSSATSTTGASSSYEGLIAGTEATEAVGAISVQHTLDGDEFIEIGSFAAGH